ncbi:MAG: RNA methyltransferase [Clostridia bacterium]|nr:RNA methyltransferase [Clostridia bacterium]
MREVITSRQNERVKALTALGEKKHRRAKGLLRADGKKLFWEAISSSAEIVEVWLSEGASDATKEAVAEAIRRGRLEERRIVYASESVFEKITDEASPEGIVTVLRAMERLHERLPQGESLDASRFAGERLLIAESLRDAGNLGTVIRSCAALGIDRLILSDDCADLYHPKTLRAAMGAIFRLPILTVGQGELASAIQALRSAGRRVYATALREGASPIGEISLRKEDCFVIGNEGHGLSDTVIEACDECAIIPMREGNESLNAAAAATVCIWETVRAK